MKSKKKLSELAKVIAKNLRATRNHLNLNQAEIAERSGIATTTYQSIENCKSEPNCSTIEAMAIALGLEPWDLCRPDFSPQEATPLPKLPQANYVVDRVEKPDAELILTLLTGFLASPPIRRALVMSIVTNDPRIGEAFPGLAQLLLISIEDLRPKS
jgi:transcriptional regulator with XRE-family HTH domain